MVDCAGLDNGVWEKLLNSAGVMVLLLDGEAEASWVNGPCLAESGRKGERRDLAGLASMLWPTELPAILDWLSGGRGGDDRLVFESEWVNAQGNNRLTRWIVLPLETGSGPARFIAAGMDCSSLLTERLLRESESSLVKSQELARMGSWTWHVGSGHMTWSETMYRLLEAPAEVLGRTYESFLGLIHPEDLEDVRETLAELVFDEAGVELEYRLLRPFGDEMWVHSRADVYYDDRGNPDRVVGIVQDITAERRAEEELKIKEAAIQSSIDAIVLADPDGRATYVNRSFVRMWRPGVWESKTGWPLTRLFVSSDEAQGMLAGLKAKGQWVGELTARRSDGRDFIVEVDGSVVRDERGRTICLMLAMADITARKRAEEMLRDQALRDGLTGLYNRRHFQDRLRAEVKSAQRHGYRLSLAMCDLDYFKTVNDTYGHQTGDDVLIGFGRLLMTSIREDDLPVRYGGEEFAVLMPHIGVAEAAVALDRIRRAFQEVEFNGEDKGLFSITASFGVAELSETEKDGGKLVEKADQALYQAKESGRNRVVFFDLDNNNKVLM